MMPFARTLTLLPLLFAATATASAAQSLSAEPFWNELQAAVLARPLVEGRFEEYRYSPLRNRPRVLHGSLRIHPELGLSLAYEGLQETVLVVTGHGLVRKGLTGERSFDGSLPGAGFIEILPQLLRIDLAALATDFEISGTHTDPAWSLTLVPRTPELKDSVAEIRLTGTGHLLERIDIDRGARRRLEIRIDEVRFPEYFAPEILERYFAPPAP